MEYKKQLVHLIIIISSLLREMRFLLSMILLIFELISLCSAQMSLRVFEEDGGRSLLLHFLALFGGSGTSFLPWMAYPILLKTFFLSLCAQIFVLLLHNHSQCRSKKLWLLWHRVEWSFYFCYPTCGGVWHLPNFS